MPPDVIVVAKFARTSPMNARPVYAKTSGQVVGRFMCGSYRRGPDRRNGPIYPDNARMSHRSHRTKGGGCPRRPFRQVPLKRLDEERREHEGDRGEELHEDVEARTGGVLEGIADGIADDRGRVCRGALADD